MRELTELLKEQGFSCIININCYDCKKSRHYVLTENEEAEVKEIGLEGYIERHIEGYKLPPIRIEGDCICYCNDCYNRKFKKAEE